MTTRAASLLCLMTLGFQMTREPASAGTSGKTRGNPPAGEAAFQTRIKPVLAKYCYGCHGEKKKGDLDLEKLPEQLHAQGV